MPPSAARRSPAPGQDGTTDAPGVSRTFRLALAAILALALGLRLYLLDRESLWLDETFSLDLARGSWSYLFDKAIEDFHPPLYFILLKIWTFAAGTSGWAARLFSAVASTAAVGVTYAAGRAFVDRRTGLVAAALVAVSAFQVEFAQEARMYALLACVGGLSTLAFLRLTDTTSDLVAGGRRSPLATPAFWAYTVTTTLLVYTQAVGAFVVLAQALVAIVMRVRQPTWQRGFERWFVANLVVGLAFMPWFPVFARQFSDVQRGFWIGPPAAMDLPGTFAVFAGSAPLAWAIGGLAVMGLAFRDRTSDGERSAPARRLLLAAWLIVPIGGQFVASLVSAPIFLPKYTIAASLPFAILAAAGLTRLPRWGTVAAVAGIVVTAASVLSTYYQSARKDDWRGVIQDLERTARPGDRVLSYPYFLQYPWDIYATRRDLDVRFFPRHAADTTWPTLSVMFQNLTGSAPRLWFILMNYDPRHDLLVGALRDRYTVVERRRRGHVDVYVVEGRK